MSRFLVQRLSAAALTLLAIITATFLALHAAGDPITTSLQAMGASPEEVRRTLEELGYDRPLVVQYFDYLSGILLRLDFGQSYLYGSDTWSIVLDRVPYTLALASGAMVLTILVAIPLGAVAARHRGETTDKAFRVFTGLGQAIPLLVIGPVLVLALSVNLGIFPVSGADGLRSLVLPVVTLSIFPIANISRVLRSSMLDVTSSDYVRTAHAKGLSTWRVTVQYVVRNSLLPVVTLLGLQIANLLGGTIVVEAIFGWPGIGSLVHQALLANDFPLAQTVVIFIAAGVLLVNLLTDAIYAVVDPRIRIQ